MSGSPRLERLQGLVGLRLSIVRRAADMLGVQFGTVRPVVSSLGRAGTAADFTLHIQAPWRFEGVDGTISGRADLWDFGGSGPEPDGWSYESGGSLQDTKLDGLFGLKSERLGWSPTSDCLQVVAVDASRYGDLAIWLDGGLVLRVFADGTGSEAWRLISAGDEAHLVFPDPGD